MSQRRIMRCLAQKFTKCTFSAKLGQNSALSSSKPVDTISICSTYELETFLVWAAGCGDVVRLHAFQFISELLHRCLSRRKAQIANDKMFDSRSALSRRTMSTSGFSGQPGTGGDGVKGQGKEETSGEANRIRSDVLNEMVICDKCTVEPCELTIMLLLRLNDILRGFLDLNGDERPSFSTSEGPNKRFSVLKIKFRQTVRNALLQSGMYRSFELCVCEFQKVDLSPLSDDEKTLFFINLFNIITVHALVTNGAPGVSLFDRYLFMRSAKYNVGGLVLNLMDIEHNILRGNTSHSLPAVFKRIPFSDRDIRNRLRIKNPRPLLSFVLFTGTFSSPALCVLTDVSTIDNDIRAFASRYLSNTVKADLATKTLYLPELIQFYWKDFGGSYVSVCAMVQNDGEPTVQVDLRNLLAVTAHPKVVFVPYDWNACLVLPT